MPTISYLCTPARKVNGRKSKAKPWAIDMAWMSLWQLIGIGLFG
ncbi:hypothetical protein [Prevotella corporis]|nr:hypothetical protein [Prevotella corporis]